MAPDLLTALFLGLVEGLTEFIPVSSTGHLLLLGHFLGFESPGHTFEILIQLGAVLAILTVYFGRLWAVFVSLPHDRNARRFVAGVLIAFLPAALIGALAYDVIEQILFEAPMLICVMLVLGGVALLAIDRMTVTPRYDDATRYPLSLCLKIGLFQCLAMVPGVSRSGATIAGALLLGTDKRSAADFSFFLAMPTMAGAFTFSLISNWDTLRIDDALTIGIGFAAAFLAAVFVVRRLLDFVARHGFAPFAWYRIALGLTGLALLLLAS